MFALLALGGDIGCSGGPTLVGMVSGAFGDNLKMGILAGIIFSSVATYRSHSLQKTKENY